MTDPRWSRAPVPWRITLGGILLATADGEPELVGPTAVVWELLDPPRTEVELSALSAREFDLDRATTIAALAALSEAGLCHAT